MLSLDVKILFTDVQIEVDLSRLKTRLREFHYSDTKVKDFINLSKLCIIHYTFEFNSSFHKRSDNVLRNEKSFIINSL